jgi:hypothetical protein
LLNELVELEERKGKIELEHGQILREAKTIYWRSSLLMLKAFNAMAVF